MMTILEMPKLGLSMKEGSVVKWLVKKGDEVQKGQGLVEIVTDKISSVLESPISGELLEIFVEEGEKAPILAPLAKIGEAGSLEDGREESFSEREEERDIEIEREEGSISPVALSYCERAGIDVPHLEGTGPGGRTIKRDIRIYLEERGLPLPEDEKLGHANLSPPAHRLALAEGVDLDGIRGTGPGGRIIKRDVKKILKERGGQRREDLKKKRPLLSPVAEAMVKKKEISTSSLEGTGPGGRIVRSDVERYLKEEESRESRERVEERDRVEKRERRGELREEEERIPATYHRQATARSMMESLRETAQATLTIEVDVGPLFQLYQRVKEEGISLNAIFIKALTQLLPSYPSFNATYQEGEIQYRKEIHVGMAVDTEGGLLVPVLKEASTKNLMTISQELRDLIQKSREGRLNPDDLSGGTITISNLGSLGIRVFTPVLNYPEVAILGIGSMKEVLMVRDGAFFPGRELILSLTIDHRLIDGAPAGRFLRDYREILEDPASLILA